MDWKTFFVEIVKGVAWPVATVCIVSMLRRPLGKLLPLLRKVKYGEWEAEFGELLKEAKEVATEIGVAEPAETREEPRTANATTQQPELMVTAEQLRKIALISPSAAVVTAWSYIELAARERIARKGAPPTVTLGELMNSLRILGGLTSGQLSLLDHLRRLRNIAAHDMGKIVYEGADQYINLALPILEALKNP